MLTFGGVPKTGYVEFMFEFKAKIENPDSRGGGPREGALGISESGRFLGFWGLWGLQAFIEGTR